MTGKRETNWKTCEVNWGWIDEEAILGVRELFKAPEDAGAWICWIGSRGFDEGSLVIGARNRKPRKTSIRQPNPSRRGGRRDRKVLWTSALGVQWDSDRRSIDLLWSCVCGIGLGIGPLSIRSQHNESGRTLVVQSADIGVDCSIEVIDQVNLQSLSSLSLLIEQSSKERPWVLSDITSTEVGASGRIDCVFG